MGKHSARDKDSKRRQAIERLDPKSESRETPGEQQRRRQRPDYSEVRKRRRRRKRIGLGCLTAFGIAFLALALAIVLYVTGINSRLAGDNGGGIDEATEAILERNRPEERGEPFYMLVMGVDNREGELRARSDTLIVARIDPREQRATLISVPRDTRVVIPGHGTNKINAANALGGPSLVIETVQDLTGLPISKFMEIDFEGFKELVDALGGVTLDVPQTIVDPQAGNYDPAAYKLYAGQQKLNGAQALTFVRSRKFPEGDLQRVKNQQLFLRAVLKESLQIGNALRVKSIIDAVVDNVTTNLTVGELLDLANDMNGMEQGALETATMPGAPQYIGGVSYVIMDEDAFAVMIERMKTGDPIEGAPGEEVEVMRMPYQVSVDVRNGAGINGVASDAGRRLRRADFDVREIGNMNQFVYDETLIVYKDDEAAAKLVQESLGVGEVVASRGMYSFSTDILLVVGKDWGPARGPNVHNIPIE